MSQGMALTPLEPSSDTPRLPATVFSQWHTGDELAAYLGVDTPTVSVGVEAGAVDHLLMDSEEVYRLRDRRGARRPPPSSWLPDEAESENATLRRQLADQRRRLVHLEAAVQALEAELDRMEAAASTTST